MKCHQVKAKHQQPIGLLQPLQILERKWEVITMGFITRLPMTSRKHDYIKIVVDKLSKSTHFIPINILTRLMRHQGF